MTTHTIFPTVIAKSYDSQFELVKDDLIAWMTNYAKTYPTNSRSNVDGYQSPDDFWEMDAFAPFLNYMSPRILDLVEEYRNHDETSFEFEPQLSNMWFNINYKHNYNVSHTHPGCVLAGVFWVSCPKQSGELVFHHLDEHNFAPIQHTNITIPPVEGGMYLFPGSLYHHVSMSYSDEPRFSIAFNLFEP